MKNTKFYLSIFFVIILAALICSCGLSDDGGGSGGTIFGKTTIDAKDYIAVNFGKYDGYSTPEIEVDFEGLSGKIDAEKFNEFKNSLSADLRFELSMYDNMAEVFEIELLEEYENVSNGDKIVVKIMADSYLESEGLTLKKLCDGLGIKFKTTEIKFTVVGLEKAENVVDIFGDVEKYICYNGTNGDGETAMHTEYNPRCATTFSPVKDTDKNWYNNGVCFPEDYSRQVGNLYFVYSDRSSLKVLVDNIKICTISYDCGGAYLSKGDKIEVTAPYVDTEIFEDYGYVVASTSKTITVPDLGEYMTSKDQLTENVISQAQNQIDTSSYDVHLVELYYVTLKPGVEQTHHSKACLVGVVKRRDILRYEYYYYYAHDIILEPDGSSIMEWEHNILGKDAIEELREIFYTDMYEYELVKTFEVN